MTFVYFVIFVFSTLALYLATKIKALRNNKKPSGYLDSTNENLKKVKQTIFKE